MSNVSLGQHPHRIDWTMTSVLLAVLIQGAGALWWASGMDRRVSSLERDMAPLRAMTVTVGRLDERTDAMREATARIERKLDNLEERR